MKPALITLVLASLCLCACSCTEKGGGQEDPIAQDNVLTSPTEVLAAAGKGDYTLEVTAPDSWQAYSNDSWITDVSPSWSSSPKGTVTFKVAENLTAEGREGAVVIKCGSVRHSVKVTQPSASSEDGISCPLDGYRLVWHDEFDDESSFGTDWKFENWRKGYVNNELQRYVADGELDGHKTASVEGGVLHITAMKYNGEVISARMNTRKSWLYGYMEARIWLPKGLGTWPAYWMMPNDQSDGWPKCGEIDIMEEVGANANYTSSSIHCDAYNHVKNTQKTKETYTANAEGSFHIYALEWTEGYIKTYVDGKELLYFANDGKNNVSTWPFDKTFYITLNLAWGGDWGGYKGVDESALPTTMKVDYVRVFQK